VDDWKKEHDGQAPKTYAERKELGEMIKAGMRTPDEENFEEAVANLWRLTASTSVGKKKEKIIFPSQFIHLDCY
jgi:amyloid beta precursor protein binding protein 1